MSQDLHYNQVVDSLLGGLKKFLYARIYQERGNIMLAHIQMYTVCFMFKLYKPFLLSNIKKKSNYNVLYMSIGCCLICWFFKYPCIHNYYYNSAVRVNSEIILRIYLNIVIFMQLYHCCMNMKPCNSLWIYSIQIEYRVYQLW